jgi:hypothetical protein
MLQHKLPLLRRKPALIHRKPVPLLRGLEGGEPGENFSTLRPKTVAGACRASQRSAASP